MIESERRAILWVYPRVCGGTPADFAFYWSTAGLSPRVRGNQLHGITGSLGQGSIPACAGEPRVVPFSSLQQRVYPRVCGGTAAL